ncbi:hypothetical protein [Sinosporangium siamense]|uniref:Uncharacterized protein n=1 Tax=Sinosporangium siamense TaxID=1367973 RepID=A0A919RPH1_9ACTN|nr:hypothetical protein [Sinosporangium siamense]GII97343.1 hypothetical protein Ssi02_75740 [Sinosporangium siamense]
MHPLPLPEPKAVTALTTVGRELWGLAGGSLFTLAPERPGDITVTRLFPDPNWETQASLAWRDGVLLTLAKDPDHVYGTLGNQIFKVNKATKE